MIDLFRVERQLVSVGFKNKFFGRPEVKELCNILSPNEVIKHAVMGHYQGGFAIIVATDYRVLLIDKKVWFLTLEDVRYDMVAEVDFCSRLLDATISVVTFNKTLVFNSWHKQSLRQLSKYIQQRVTEIRHIEAGMYESPQESISTPNQLVSYTNPNRQMYLTTPKDANNDSDTDNSFLVEYQQAQIKRHSLAHIAGKLATEDFNRPRPLIKPLYPRPSLATHYKQSGFGGPSAN